MKRRFKQIVALMLALASLVGAFAEEETPEESLRRLRLGSSVYTVMIDDDFVRGEVT
ncbi:MAG: hypothetical protein Q4C10_06565 [Clostridia bacterium]|nr:hypothetical protein [Clostridia bacterium]